METISLDDAIRSIVKEENSQLFSKIKTLLLNVEKESYSKPLNFEETLKYLDCSKSFLYKLTSNNSIPHSKRGKRLYFDAKELNLWLLEKSVKTKAQIKADVTDYLYKRK